VSLVLDTSLTLSWFFDDERTPTTDALLDEVSEGGATVPTLWRLEVANALQMATLDRELRTAASAVGVTIAGAVRDGQLCLPGDMLQAWFLLQGRLQEGRPCGYDKGMHAVTKSNSPPKNFPGLRPRPIP
jgi:hypothetical protein